MKKCLIVEDRIECRLWLESLVQQVFFGVEIIHADRVATGRAALTTHPVNMALVDIGLPDGSGIELVRQIRENAPHIAVTVMTLFDDDTNLFDALRAGAQGYLLKSQPQEQILAQLQALKAGVLPIAPSIARRALAFFIEREQKVDQSPAKSTASLPRLSSREQEVLKCIVRGETVKHLAATLNMAPSTAADHVRSIYEKLGAGNRAEAVAKAVRCGVAG